MRRVILFLAVNFLVVITISMIIQFFGLQPYISRSGMNPMGLLIFCALFGFVGSFISLQLSRWTAKRAMGVELIDLERPANTTQSYIVEKVRALCAGAGLRSLPEIGVYPSDEVNAFATGPSESRALLAISSGLLNHMDDRAVEGVLGHEISHIANGDMVTMALLQGVANTFVMFFARVIAFAIDQALRARDDERSRGGGLGYFGYFIVVSLLETVLMLLANIVVYWFSRLREYRADAGSARISGRDTMIHALESLKPCAHMVDNRQASVSAFKINGRGHGLLAMLYSSHPTIEDRIKALKEARY